jgi:hypothetical protein
MDTFDKYETKRSGLTLNEALEAATIGYRVRCDLLTEDAFVYYAFDRYRIQFADIRGRIGNGSNSAWDWTPAHKSAEWSIFDPQPKPVDKWGVAVFESNRGDRTPKGWGEPQRDSWGRIVT